MFFMYFIGTAGSGKSTLTASFAEWLKDHELDAITVNLDPGVRILPYTPDVDARDYIKVEDVMLNFDLGPNGALIASVDMLTGKIDKIKEEIEELKPGYVLIDTPGQMELFAYRSAGPLIVSALGGENQASIYLVDPILAKNPYGYVSVLLLGISVEYRFQIPQVYVLSKSDLLEEKEKQKILGWSEDFYKLAETIDREFSGLRREMSLKILGILNEMGRPGELIPVSAARNEGLDDLYAILQRIYAGGEDF
ncbi:MAG: ATP/GTP-binding protein [Candidatus Odinarchaeota archaeon]|nr:ATP/GTP-binding protein [Candidatus Odinarchaeota archaeon]